MRETAKTIGLLSAALLTLFGLQAFVLEIKEIHGPSMEPALTEGRFVVINRLEYGLRVPFGQGYLFHWKAPAPGDIVVFSRPSGSNHFVVKRCLGRSGDSFIVAEDALEVNGFRLPLTGEQRMRFSGYGAVPPGMVFLAGDNLERSLDSRDLGFIPVEDIQGKMLF